MERTISGMMGKGSLTHNRRAFTAENVDAERTKNNIEYCNESLKQVYHTLFDEAVNRYNAKQTRKDRMIENYYDKIRTGKQEKLFYEAVFQIGNKDDMNVRGEHGELAKQILDEFMQDFQKRNPNLYVFSAHLHLDEETPHLHIDFVPYTTGSKRGLDTRVSLKQALKMQGFEGSNRQETEWNLWIASEKQQLSSVMERHGIQWLKLGTHHKHLSVLNFEKQEREKEVLQLDKQLEEASCKVAATERQVKSKKEEVLQAEKELTQMVSNRAKVEKNIQIIQNDKEWQLPEPTTLMSAKAYKEKKAEPLVARLKEVLQTVMINNLDLNRKLESTGKRLEQIRKQLNRLENRLESVQQENDVLREQNSDLKRLKMVLGEEKVISIIEHQKAAEIPDNKRKSRNGMER
ncbi:plasmid recombination protein [Robinsoniella sp. KNHs210]|uniref:plasmid recombination protein n=1 Tax=Robinsoniella sp. KNHs210 TaxID=1469950 RepID=UPI00047FACA2|nr:plasmid recombination protein [Robinsoniella sp. KNHs210]